MPNSEKKYVSARVSLHFLLFVFILMLLLYRILLFFFCSEEYPVLCCVSKWLKKMIIEKLQPVFSFKVSKANSVGMEK